ncbi:MAG: Rieske 2Fe-2S domain-containing protein [Mycobacterium sp.]
MTSALVALSATGPLGRQWLPVASSADIQDGPAGVRLLARDLVLWRSPIGAVVAAPNLCTHSKGDLTKGEVNSGRLVCPKHGWTFGDEGRCVFKPSGLPISDKAHLKTHPCTERYGLVWVSLGDPAAPVMDLAWDDDRYRRIHNGASVWQSNSIQIMETLLAEGDCPYVDVTTEVPFFVRGAFKSDDGATHRRLISCAPVDNRTSLVTSVVWTNRDGRGDDAKIVNEVMADLDEVKSAAEKLAGPASAEIAFGESRSADWKRRLLTFLGHGVE